MKVAHLRGGSRGRERQHTSARAVCKCAYPSAADACTPAAIHPLLLTLLSSDITHVHPPNSIYSPKLYLFPRRRPAQLPPLRLQP